MSKWVFFVCFLQAISNGVLSRKRPSVDIVEGSSAVPG